MTKPIFAFPFLAVLTACGGTSVGSSTGGLDAGADQAANGADVYIEAILEPSFQDAGICPYGGPQQMMSIGGANLMGPIPVSNGTSQNGATVSSSCSVVDGFDVHLTASVGGIDAGYTNSLTISGRVAPGSGGSGIQAALAARGYVFSSTTCTVGFTFAGSPVPIAQPVAPGSIWAHLSCPTMSTAGGASVCDVEVDFQFENCSQ